ncbi:uncharacterized protein BO97DRAFT_439446 [Aspergillus homomorphus CBS 101889]|uniref:RRM domain-containing protein n=1 Tax=Aspergillus homomorphus (strain CBS 101889) TaxID=1450537 RepID=A0A395IBZ6_ASPHC|nr:hypothetical protein BO97DRAFT_439446 [Aspergillus homomorphus CBS 101889]RAL17566.1 hypothetical protein BO97DRAFT_439446 [Aspergillus homomorphus CBS 101889]
MSLPSKTISILMQPAPRTLSESKVVLSALQKFGEVVTFRNLKYDVTNKSKTTRPIIAIFESTAAASAALAASPLCIPLPGQQQQQQQQLPGGVAQQQPESSAQSQHESATATATEQENLTPTTTSQETPQPQSTSTPTIHPSARIRTGNPTPTPPPGHIMCSLLSARHNHDLAVRRNPWQGGFALERTTHPHMYDDLVRTGIPLAELADGPAGRKGSPSPLGPFQVARDNQRWGAVSLMELAERGRKWAEEVGSYASSPVMVLDEMEIKKKKVEKERVRPWASRPQKGTSYYYMRTDSGDASFDA